MWSPPEEHGPRRSSGEGATELLLVLAGFAALTIAYTFPLAFHLGSIGYKVHIVGDGQYSIWNVAWVAHALLTSPRHVLDANIFYPHARTLVYSEANLVAGALGVPVFWLTGGNPYATHNFVVLLSFVLSATGTYYLTRYLSGDRRAAVIAAISFAYCPYVLSRLSHIQLLMTAGMPFSLLAFHRMRDRPSPGRGVALGLAMGLQALACAYYGVFVALLIGLAVVLGTSAPNRSRDRRYWIALLAGAAVALALVLPLFATYRALHTETGFERGLGEARSYSATWRTYLRSAATASSVLESATQAGAPSPQDTSDVLFPGFVATLFGCAGIVIGWRAAGRVGWIVLLYGAIAALAFWESFGPSAGLYAITYRIVPGFSFLRAPSRFGVLVVLSLSALTAMAISAWLRRSSRPLLLTAALLLLACAEHITALRFTAVPAVEPAYRVLANQPSGAVIEMPPLSLGFTRTTYMLSSTVHWKPLVNAYSDYIPADFLERLPTLATFPSREAFAALAEGVRYAVFHLDNYRRDGQLDKLTTSLQTFAPYLKRVYGDDHVWLYEIVEKPN